MSTLKNFNGINDLEPHGGYDPPSVDYKSTALPIKLIGLKTFACGISLPSGVPTIPDIWGG